MRKPFLISTLFVVISLTVFSQKTVIYSNENLTYNSAIELYDKEKFSAAQEKFDLVLKNSSDNKSEITVNAMYYKALCGLQLFNIDAEALLIEFTLIYPESPKVKLAYFHLGNYQFRKRKYKKALNWYSKIDIYDLTNEEIAEYQFKVGYSYFIEKDYKKASNAFFEIKDTDNKYSAPAKYYYAHIAYLEKKYESSLKTFQSLGNHPKFSPIVPYYITQIYHFQEKYDALIQYAPALLDTAKPNRVPEIARLIGDAYYQTKKYDKAIPYFKRFHKEKAFAANREDKYQLGYAYFKNDNYQEALKWFKMVIAKDGRLTQTTHYHIAKCYLKLNKKKYARNSFREAAKLDHDLQIKEDALFSFAKISYELSFHPFNDAIKAFEEFINTYPNSSKLNDAYEFLVTVYYSTKNYKAALSSLENIKKLDIQLQEAYQKIAFYRGVNLFNDHNYTDAIAHFDKSDKYIINQQVKVKNAFWRAEANYRLKKYVEAIKGYKQFIYEPEAIASNNLNEAHYNIGYSYFKLKEYNNANIWFRKYVQNTNENNSKTKNDALNRIADCFFINQNYKAAIEYYDKAALLSLYQADYSLYQSAVTNGVIGNYSDKVNLLTTLIHRKEKSHLLDDAIFELGKTLLIQNKNDEALINFQLLIDKHPNSPYLSKALVKKGLIYYNKKDDDNALSSFKKVVQDYPKTSESSESLSQIKKIYVEKGELETYEIYLKDIGSIDSSAMVLDADYYEVAENSYLGGNCEKAVSDLSKYLEKYPNGISVLNAHYYRAICELKANYINEALIDFDYIIAKPKSKFTENSLLQSAKINQQLGNIEIAINNYSQLEYLADVPENILTAQIEQMRLNFKQKNYNEAIKYCQLLINKDIENNQLITESHLIFGKATMAQDDYNLALTEFTTASSATNKFGVEAKYNVAYIMYLRGEYNSCETEIFSLIKKYPSYDYWIGKALLLLADNYLAIENIFQTKATLKSIIDNSKHSDLVASATEKLEIILKQENEANNTKEEEIDLNLNDDLNLDKLFIEEEIIEEEITEPNKELEIEKDENE